MYKNVLIFLNLYILYRYILSLLFRDFVNKNLVKKIITILINLLWTLQLIHRI